MSETTITDEEYAAAQQVVAQRQAEDNARYEAQREALIEPISALVNSEAFETVVAEAKRIVAEYPDERQIFGLHLNALINGSTNLKQSAETGVTFYAPPPPPPAP